MNLESGQEEYEEKAQFISAEGIAADRIHANAEQNYILANPNFVAGPSSLPESLLEEAAGYVLQQTTGLDTDGDHGANTPARFIRMLRELTTSDWDTETFTCFDNSDGLDEMVTVERIPFVSVCNHHVVPFHGYAYIAYIPGARIAGLSKFARVVRHFAKQLQVQERLTIQIADFLEDKLEPIGVAVVLRAEHMCMTIRGVQTPGTRTTTSAMRGVFADHDRTAKQEFLEWVRNGH